MVNNVSSCPQRKFKLEKYIQRKPQCNKRNKGKSDSLEYNAHI